MSIEEMKAKREELEVRLLTSSDERTKELLTQCIEDLRETIRRLSNE